MVHDSLKKLRTRQITELPSHPSPYPFFPTSRRCKFLFFAAFAMMSEYGEFDLQPSHPLNDGFPDIKPRTIKELVLEAWKKHEKAVADACLKGTAPSDSAVLNECTEVLSHEEQQRSTAFCVSGVLLLVCLATNGQVG